MRRLVLGDDHSAAGILVKTMNDSWPARISGIQRAHMVQKGIHQCSGSDPCSDMADEAGRFVDYSEIGIFVQNMEWNGVRMRLVIRRGGQLQGNMVI